MKNQKRVVIEAEGNPVAGCLGCSVVLLLIAGAAALAGVFLGTILGVAGCSAKALWSLGG